MAAVCCPLSSAVFGQNFGTQQVEINDRFSECILCCCYYCVRRKIDCWGFLRCTWELDGKDAGTFCLFLATIHRTESSLRVLRLQTRWLCVPSCFDNAGRCDSVFCVYLEYILYFQCIMCVARWSNNDTSYMVPEMHDYYEAKSFHFFVRTYNITGYILRIYAKGMFVFTSWSNNIGKSGKISSGYHWGL